MSHSGAAGAQQYSDEELAAIVDEAHRAGIRVAAHAPEVFPKAREMLGKAIKAGVKIACGTDAPAVPHGQNAKELWAMVEISGG